MDEFDKNEIKSDLKLIFGGLFITIVFIMLFILATNTKWHWTVKESLTFFWPLFMLTAVPVTGIALIFFALHDIVQIISQYNFIIAIPKGDKKHEE